MKKAPSKRDQLIDVAADLFNRMGYHAAGIDRVIEATGIAKTTLYRHFQSKEDLIVAVLKRVDERFRQDMRSMADALANNPDDKLIATFDFLENWFGEDSFNGCPFISAASEYARKRGNVFHEAALHKRLMVSYLEELARAADFADPAAIAEEINLLHEGAIAVAHITGNARPARQAKAAAQKLLDRADRSPSKKVTPPSYSYAGPPQPGRPSGQ